MTTTHDVQLGLAADGSPVAYWGGYGVVCPAIVTTNGSLAVLMRSHARPVSLTDAGMAFFIGRAIFALGGHYYYREHNSEGQEHDKAF